MKFTRPLLLILFCLLQITAEAQTIPSKNLKFESLTIADGLSQGMINCMVQDHFGFMWFGTKDGLNRYDGYHFVVYRHDPSDSNSVADNFIQALFEDAEGRLWVGTSNRGLDLFDRKTETFSHFKHEENNTNSLCDNRIINVTEDGFGNIWVCTFNGLDKITFEQDKSGDRKKLHSPSVVFSHYLSDECRIFKTSDGTLWASAMHGGSLKIHPSKNGADEIDTLDMSRYCWYPYEDRGFENFIQLMVEDTVNRELFLITEFSISKVNLSSGNIEILSKQRNHWGKFGVTQCIDANHVIWLSESDWLEQFDVTTKQWYRIYSEDAALDLAVNNSGVTYHDRSGIIWIGTKGYGILKYNPRSEKFHKMDNVSIQWMHSTNNDSTIILLQNRLFMCTFNFVTGKFILLNDSAYLPQIKSFVDFGISSAAIQDHHGVYWLGKNSLWRYDPSVNEIEDIRSTDENVFPVFLDNRDHIWFGTSRVLSMYDPEKTQITDYNYPISPQRQPYEFLQCMYQDASGIFWLGTISGLLRFDTDQKSWKQFRNIPNDTTSLSFDVIFCICPDPKSPEKYLWIGTNGGGLNRFDMETGKVIRYSQKDGLPNDVVYGILSDDDGNLWLSTNKGLSRFNPDKKSFKNFEMKDGLQGNEFNRYAFCSARNPADKSHNLLLFFGGTNGFNYFDPKELADNPFIPNVEITDFKLRNKSIAFSNANSPLKQPIFLTDKIVLRYSENMISFEFASMDFTSPEKNLYRYRLDGFDHDWIQSGNAHTATYTNLDPGNYTFTVLGSNNDGVWNEKGKSIQLIILPPWYMTWWFRIGVVVVIAGLLYALYRYRIQQAMQLQVVRNRIASDLHDEIGSNLSNISIFSEVAQEKFSDPAKMQPLLKKISEYTQSSQEAMSDIVWMINARNDRFENIIVRMRALAAELFEAKNYQLHMNFDERLNEMKLGMESRKNFYLLYKEALNNIAKYAECKNVWIEMKMNHSSVSLRIADDGIGFNAEAEYYGNGLNNMKQRAEVLKGNLSIHSDSGKGTIVDLKFTP